MRIQEKTLRQAIRQILLEQEEKQAEEGAEEGAEEAPEEGGEESGDLESDGVDNDGDGEVDEEGETAEEKEEAKEEAALGEDGVDDEIENKGVAIEELQAFIKDGIPQIPNNQLDALMDQFKILAQQAADGKLAAKEEEIQRDVAQNTGDDEAEAAAATAEEEK
jgi:hypothetical protein